MPLSPPPLAPTDRGTGCLTRPRWSPPPTDEVRGVWRRGGPSASRSVVSGSREAQPGRAARGEACYKGHSFAAVKTHYKTPHLTTELGEGTIDDGEKKGGSPSDGEGGKTRDARQRRRSSSNVKQDSFLADRKLLASFALSPLVGNSACDDAAMAVISISMASSPSSFSSPFFSTSRKGEGQNKSAQLSNKRKRGGSASSKKRRGILLPLRL